MPTGSFGLGAYIVSDRWRHDINNDHFGDLSTLSVIIEAPIGRWPQGTPLHFVLDDIATMLSEAESKDMQLYSFGAYAIIVGPGGTVTSGSNVRSALSVNAIRKRSYTATFAANAVKGKAFTIDAIIRAQAYFSVNAVIV